MLLFDRFILNLFLSCIYFNFLIFVMKVHRCKFIPYVSHAINCFAITADGKKLAVGRENADIEIYNLEQNWFLEKRISGGKNLSVESLAWTNESQPRLFSAGLHSVITQWDLDRLCPKYESDSYGGAVWCISIQSGGTILAAGCEDGCVRLFDIGSDGITYLRSFEHHDGRVLSMAWHSSGDFLVTGGSDSHLRKWDVQTGRATHHLALETRNSTPTLVWSVAVLTEGCIVGGDSIGNVHFWYTNGGESIQTIQSHDLDVLCLTSPHDSNSVFASGVDNKIVRFISQTGANGRRIWSISNSRRYHSHDVRALTIANFYDQPLLISGGIDTNIMISILNDHQSSVKKIIPFPQHPVIHLCPSKQIVVHQDWFSLHLFRIKSHETFKSANSLQSQKAPLENGSFLEKKKFSDPSTFSHSNTNDIYENNYCHLLDIIPQSDYSLSCSAVSQDGNYISCGSREGTKLFRIVYDPNGDFSKVGVEKCFLSKDILPAHRLLFSADNLIVATQDMTLQVVRVETGEILRTFEHHIENGISTILSLAASVDGQWLASCDLNGRIFVYHLDSLQLYTAFPILENAITHLSFDGKGKQLIATLSNNFFVIFDMEKKGISDWTLNHPINSFPDMFKMNSDMLRGAVFAPSNSQEIILYGIRFLCRVDLSKKMPPKKDNLLRLRKNINVEKKEHRERKNIKATHGNFRMTYKYQPLLFAGFLESESLLVVERDWLDLMRSLPETYRRKRYGT